MEFLFANMGIVLVSGKELIRTMALLRVIRKINLILTGVLVLRVLILRLNSENPVAAPAEDQKPRPKAVSETKVN